MKDLKEIFRNLQPIASSKRAYVINQDKSSNKIRLHYGD